jgi:hypothetical protein
MARVVRNGFSMLGFLIKLVRLDFFSFMFLNQQSMQIGSSYLLLIGQSRQGSKWLNQGHERCLKQQNQYTVDDFKQQNQYTKQSMILSNKNQYMNMIASKQQNPLQTRKADECLSCFQIFLEH